MQITKGCKSMLTISEIRIAVEKIAPDYLVKQVQLFGSYADGLADLESDVDVKEMITCNMTI